MPEYSFTVRLSSPPQVRDEAQKALDTTVRDAVKRAVGDTPELAKYTELLRQIAAAESAADQADAEARAAGERRRVAEIDPAVSGDLLRVASETTAAIREAERKRDEAVAVIATLRAAADGWRKLLLPRVMRAASVARLELRRDLQRRQAEVEPQVEVAARAAAREVFERGLAAILAGLEVAELADVANRYAKPQEDANVAALLDELVGAG